MVSLPKGSMSTFLNILDRRRQMQSLEMEHQENNTNYHDTNVDEDITNIVVTFSLRHRGGWGRIKSSELKQYEDRF